jgi:hypothetical protein
MSFKQINPGLLSALRGCELIAFSFRVNGSSDPNGLVQGGSNAIASVVRASAGTYTVTLNKTWPRQIVAIVAAVASATATVGAIETVRYVVDSYSTADGAFELETITDDGDGTLTIEDITDNSVISVIMVVQNHDALVEDDAA